MNRRHRESKRLLYGPLDRVLLVWQKHVAKINTSRWLGEIRLVGLTDTSMRQTPRVQELSPAEVGRFGASFRTALHRNLRTGVWPTIAFGKSILFDASGALTAAHWLLLNTMRYLSITLGFLAFEGFNRFEPVVCIHSGECQQRSNAFKTHAFRRFWMTNG